VFTRERRAVPLARLLVEEEEWSRTARGGVAWNTAVTLLVEALPEVVRREHALVHERLPTWAVAGARPRDLRLGGEPEPDRDLADALAGRGGLRAPHLAVLERDGPLHPSAATVSTPESRDWCTKARKSAMGNPARVAGEDAARARDGAADRRRAARDEEIPRGRKEEEAPGAVGERAAGLVDCGASGRARRGRTRAS